MKKFVFVLLCGCVDLYAGSAFAKAQCPVGMTQKPSADRRPRPAAFTMRAAPNAPPDLKPEDRRLRPAKHCPANIR